MYKFEPGPQAIDCEKRAWVKPYLGIEPIDRITEAGTSTVSDTQGNPQNNPGGGGSAPGGGNSSDIRLKRDVCEVGATPDGLTLYSFRYNWSEETFVGVMAQEVLEVKPHAVITREDGFYAVDYDMLGLKMISLDKWRETKRIH